MISFYNIVKKNYYGTGNTPLYIISMSENKRQEVYNHLCNEFTKGYSFSLEYLHKCEYYYTLSYNNITFFIISKSNIKNHNEVKKIFIRIIILCRIYNIKKAFKIFIIMNPYKRYLPKKGVILKKHINGGFTYINNNNIYILRKEDWTKVILHEILHHNVKINNDNWDKKDIARLKKYFNISELCEFNPNEAVIEAYASYYNTCFTAIENNYNFKELYKIHKAYSVHISNKIIKFQNNNIWYETSNAYSYTVIKNIIYCNFSKFLKIFKYTSNDIADFIIKYDKKMNDTIIFNTKNSLKLTY